MKYLNVLGIKKQCIVDKITQLKQSMGMAEMMNGMTPMEKTVWEKKYIYKDDEHEYAKKGIAGTGLGIGIAALALTVLGRNGLGNILGNGTDTRLEDTKEFNKEFFGLYKSQVDADFGLYKSQRDADDAIVAKHNADAFSLYKYSRDNFDILKAQIDDIKTQVAVQGAVQPWKDKSIYDAIALERERRESADCQIVGYTNCTFIPQYVADITPAATSTQKATRNPLCCCNN